MYFTSYLLVYYACTSMTDALSRYFREVQGHGKDGGIIVRRWVSSSKARRATKYRRYNTTTVTFHIRRSPRSLNHLPHKRIRKMLAICLDGAMKPS